MDLFQKSVTLPVVIVSGDLALHPTDGEAGADQVADIAPDGLAVTGDPEVVQVGRDLRLRYGMLARGVTVQHLEDVEDNGFLCDHFHGGTPFAFASIQYSNDGEGQN